MYRILTSNGSKTTTELVELAVRSKGVQVKSLSVQNTTWTMSSSTSRDGNCATSR